MTYLIATHQTDLMYGGVSSSYNSFSYIVLLFLTVQMGMLWREFQSTEYSITRTFSQLTVAFSYLFSTLLILSSGTIGLLLTFYPTQG